MPTRVRILDAAAGLLAEPAGYEAMSIATLSIASEASNGSIYHHFGSKEGVLLALLRRARARFQAGVLRVLREHDGDAAAGVRAVVAYVLSWTEERPEDARLLLEHTTRLPPDRAFLKAVDRWLEAQAGAGSMPRVGLRTAHALALAPAEAFLVRWLHVGAPPVPTTHAARLGDAAWAALQAAGPDPA